MLDPSDGKGTPRASIKGMECWQSYKTRLGFILLLSLSKSMHVGVPAKFLIPLDGSQLNTNVHPSTSSLAAARAMAELSGRLLGPLRLQG